MENKVVRTTPRRRDPDLQEKVFEMKNPERVEEQWIDFMAELNALDYLEKAYQYMCQVENSPMEWKSVILSLHGALYGFAVCVCHGTDWENVNDAKKEGNYHLIGFKKVLSRCQDGEYMTAFGEVPLDLSEAQSVSIEKLKKFRDRFEHYMPMSWHIEVHGMPQIAIDALEVIRFLAVECSMWVRDRLKSKNVKIVKSLVYQSKKVLRKTQLYKEARLVTD